MRVLNRDGDTSQRLLERDGCTPAPRPCLSPPIRLVVRVGHCLRFVAAWRTKPLGFTPKTFVLELDLV